MATGWENTSPVYTNQPHTPQKNTLTCNYLAPLVAHRLVPRRSLPPYDTVLPVRNRLRLFITHSAVGFPVCLGVWVVWLLGFVVLGGGGSCLVCCVVSAWGSLSSLRSGCAPLPTVVRRLLVVLVTSCLGVSRLSRSLLVTWCCCGRVWSPGCVVVSLLGGGESAGRFGRVWPCGGCVAVCKTL